MGQSKAVQQLYYPNYEHTRLVIAESGDYLHAYDCKTNKAMSMDYGEVYDYILKVEGEAWEL